MNHDDENQVAATPSDAIPLSADSLFAGKREVTIEFNGEIYRLRITRNNKLILTK